MTWPARSPDINPIEHVWVMLGKRVRGRLTPHSNLQQLRNVLSKEWNRIDQTDIQNLIEGFNRRMVTAIQSRGGQTALYGHLPNHLESVEHFIGGCKSQNPASPAYVPSIFPECYKRESTGTDSLNRFKRLKKRTEIISQPDTSDPLEDSASILVTTKTDAQTQTDRNYDKESKFEFSCMVDGNNVSTQACISAFHALYAKPKCSSKLSGSDSPYEKRGFLVIVQFLMNHN
ncbi:hypothetical protein ANN_17846 [Periplaneta americana]|uniref:Tc1-like transposase DDE domain-containing protein n=1 Tax=Periplaneta americana TaxID=6978 RepID=A0ABQ8SVE8_PERAM|nr:hypothetical protein ANN_17846 [Periplaneta americana]